MTGLVSVTIIYIIAKYYSNKFTKYIPIILSIILGMLSIIDIYNGSVGFKKVYHFVSTIIWIEIVITMLITAIVIDKKNTNKG